MAVMYAGEVLRFSEALALNNNQVIGSDNGFISHVTKNKQGNKSKTKKSFKAAGLIVIIIFVILTAVGSGTTFPSIIQDRLTEEFDIQYAYAVETKRIFFQQALRDGSISDDTVKLLKERGVLVGYTKDGEFIEANKTNQSLSLMRNGEIIQADDFVKTVKVDRELDNIIEEATYPTRSAYYFDSAAEEVFQEIGTTRNNYQADSKLDDVMDNLLGSGSDIKANSVSLVQKTRKNETTGEEEVYYKYEENGAVANSENDNFVSLVSSKIKSDTKEKATLGSADILNTADTISKEKRSSLFYLVFMENISKMKAGNGNTSEVNEAMNYLYRKAETEVVDTKTGKIVKVSGTPLESPSLYAVLSGNNVNPEKTENYSSERILKTVENQLGTKDSEAIYGTVTSSSTGVSGAIGRFISSGVEEASGAILDLVTPTVSKSLKNNSYETIQGIDAGEMLVEGAVNVGRKLAKKSGATAGDAAAVLAYMKLNSEVLARDAEIDRMNRSPFDITSKNTFLGSIVYNFAMGLSLNGNSSVFSSFSSILSNIGSAMMAILPTAHADNASGFLTNIGDCEKYGMVGAVGTVQCSELDTFDISTLDDPFNNAEFIAFVEANTTLDASGSRTINDNSILANFIKYALESKTPLGVISSEALYGLNGQSPSTDIANMIETFMNASDSDKRIALGGAFVNSSTNPDWQKYYRFAQLYVALARTGEIHKEYTDDGTAYNKMRFFEGEVSPVTAFINNYRDKVAKND